MNRSDAYRTHGVLVAFYQQDRVRSIVREPGATIVQMHRLFKPLVS